MSDNLIKQKILRVLLYNVELYDKTLSYFFKNPWGDFIKLKKKPQDGADSQLWCTKTDVTLLADTLIASATENTDNYLLQELVEDLNLNSELLSV